MSDMREMAELLVGSVVDGACAFDGDDLIEYWRIVKAMIQEESEKALSGKSKEYQT